MVFFGQLKLIRGGRLAAGVPGVKAVLASAYTSSYGEVFFSRCGYHSSTFLPDAFNLCVLAVIPEFNELVYQ